VKVGLTVNGNEIIADVEDRMLLVHFLRDVADLTATNIGCDNIVRAALAAAEVSS
jgi:aerobic carbon-monoxide dehydrogenase small subunit